jgi:uncharacterized protein (UPF0335 family)
MAKAEKPAKNPKGKVKLTDTERHKRFIETARDVEADESEEGFDKAIRQILKLPLKKPSSNASRDAEAASSHQKK